jgi:hypothetical protein
MFGSRSPRLSTPPSFSVNSVPSALKSSPQLDTKPHPSTTTQLVPSFSTTRKHFAPTNTRQPLSLGVLLRDSPYAPGAAIHCDRVARPFRRTPINHLEATLTNFPAKADSKPRTQNLNPLYATLTKIAGVPHDCAIHYPLTHRSPLTTHSPYHSVTLCLRGTP